MSQNEAKTIVASIESINKIRQLLYVGAFDREYFEMVTEGDEFLKGLIQTFNQAYIDCYENMQPGTGHCDNDIIPSTVGEQI